VYPDAVSYAGWPQDLHSPFGVDDPTLPPNHDGSMPYVYSTPLRSLCAGAKVPNLMAVGRLASFSHVAYGSQRVMATCQAMGQGAGAAAAYCIAKGVTPYEAAQDPAAVWSI